MIRDAEFSPLGNLLYLVQGVFLLLCDAAHVFSIRYFKSLMQPQREQIGTTTRRTTTVRVEISELKKLEDSMTGAQCLGIRRLKGV